MAKIESHDLGLPGIKGGPPALDILQQGAGNGLRIILSFGIEQFLKEVIVYARLNSRFTLREVLNCLVPTTIIAQIANSKSLVSRFVVFLIITQYAWKNVLDIFMDFQGADGCTEIIWRQIPLRFSPVQVSGQAVFFNIFTQWGPRVDSSPPPCIRSF